MTRRILTKYCKPKSTGLRHVEFLELSLTDLNSISFGANSVRFDGEDKKVIDQFTQLLKNGDYDPAKFAPPTVELNKNGKYDLTTGHHRLKSHQVLDRDTMIVSVVEFDKNTQGMSPDFWRRNWKRVENRQFLKFVANPGTDNDIWKSISEDINNGTITDDEWQIEKALTSCGIKKGSKKFEKLLNKILIEHGLGHRVVQFFTAPEANEQFGEHYINNHPDEAVIESYFKEFFDTDYDSRAERQWLDLFIDNPDRMITIISRAINVDEHKLKEMREVKEIHLVHAFVDKILKAAELIKAGHTPQVQQLWLPQLHGEDVEYEKTKKLIKV